MLLLSRLWGNEKQKRLRSDMLDDLTEELHGFRSGKEWIFEEFLLGVLVDLFGSARGLWFSK
jgi:hypothetical protein